MVAACGRQQAIGKILVAGEVDTVDCLAVRAVVGLRTEADGAWDSGVVDAGLGAGDRVGLGRPLAVTEGGLVR